MVSQPFLAVAMALLAHATLTAQGSQSNTEPPEWELFRRWPAAQREQVQERLAPGLPASAFRKSLHAVGEDLLTAPTERAKRLAERHGKRVLAAEADGPPTMPQTVRYVFGVGGFEWLSPGTNGAKKPTAASLPSPETVSTHVHQALLGIAPGADLALAGLLLHLDRDAGADDFAAFLHAWRNGDESFYEALDRTAGTKDSVFFYDAMLGDFRSLLARDDSPAARTVRSSLSAAHDALHEAFLAYRQYRGFREAVAWSLVLPPDRSLPARLRRYEAAAAAGTYSLRQQVVMVSHLFDEDLRHVADEIVRTAPPLPNPLWVGGYDPYPAWNALFTALLPRMIEAADSSDAFLQRAVTKRRLEAEAIAAAARAAIEAQAKAPHEGTPR